MAFGFWNDDFVVCILRYRSGTQIYYFIQKIVEHLNVGYVKHFFLNTIFNFNSGI